MVHVRLFSIALLLMLAFGSCKDHGECTITPEKEDANYLVMFYGLGGGNLDTSIVGNIIQAIDEGGSDKVKMTFEYKVSKPLQKSDTCANFNGTRRFTLDDNVHLKGRYQSVSKKYPQLDDDAFAYYMKELRSEKIGGDDLDMTSAESLADFIKWSKSKYPGAKRAILVLSDHGGGWSINRDGIRGTRAVLFDDNLKDAYLTAQAVVDGINGGGGIDLLYDDACLMSMYENLYTYAKGVKYLMAAVEVTAGDGGDYRKLLSLLKSAGTEEADLVRTMHTYTDYCTSDQWWSRKDAELMYNDIGLFDLSKLGTATPALRKVASTLAEKLASNESVQPTAPLPSLGESYVPYIRKAFTSAAVSYRTISFEVSSLPKALTPYVLKDITPDKDPDTGEDVVDGRKLIDWVRFAQSENAQEAYNLYKKDWDKLKKMIVTSTHLSFSLTDLLRNLNNELTAVGAQNNPFGQLHKELVDAIRRIAYISCSTPDALPGIDQPYELCSPGIVIVPLNELYDIDPLYDAIKTHQEALGYYQSSDFDKQVGWSEVLKLIDVRPSMLTNPGRNDIKLK